MAAHRLVSSLALCLWVASCQGSASVTMSFDNRAQGQALTLASDGRTPTVFGVRIVTAYMVEDRDEHMDSVGEVGRIWTNPVCDADGYQCGIGPGAGAYRVTDYFDLALPSEEVNARLNSQASDIKPATYRWLHLDLAGPQGSNDRSVPNMHFGTTGSMPVEVRRDNGYWVQLDPPLVLADGDAVTMSLGYDVRSAYFDGAGLNSGHPPDGYDFGDWYCADGGGLPLGGPCLAFKGFFPSVARKTAR
jgi:hypothetical protein